MTTSSFSSEARIAIEALVLVERGLSERSAVARVSGRDSKNKGFQGGALKLVLGTVAEQDLLDKIVQKALPRRNLSVEERCLARLTAWIALNQSRTPALEAMSGLRVLATARFRPDLEYLWGFLQTFEVSKLFAGLGDADRVALQTHHGRWWVDYCFRVFGRGEAIRILGFHSRPRYVRVNSLRNDGATTLPREARAFSHLLEPLDSFPGVYRVTQSPSSFSPLFSSGLLQFQDLASYCSVLAGDPRPGQFMLDLCGAPGAKTCALAQLMKNNGEIISVDYSVPRMKTWKTEMDRLGVRIGNPVIGDASRLGLSGLYDLVLVDPPCSGTGIFDRNPRMKWHITRERVERYSQLQGRMLEEAYRLLDPRGRIVYCTCSITVEENEGVVSSFLGMHPEMQVRPFPLSRTIGSPGLSGLSECRRFYPHSDGTAGYFIARLERSN